MAVTAYIVIEVGTTAELVAEVAAKVAEGYQPYGPLFMRDRSLLQAMIQGAPVTADDQFDDTAVNSRLDALETTVDTPDTGLADVVADHEARIAALEGA